MDNLLAEWIKFSDMDLMTAKHLYDTMHPQPLEIICYHCQQSAEKILKAFLIYSGVKPEKTHDLEFLRNECEKINKSLIKIADECDRLNPYSSQPRYPMEIEITEGDVIFALRDGAKIYEFINKVLKIE